MKRLMIMSSPILLLIKTLLSSALESDTITIYSACNNLPDGVQYILPYGDFSSVNHPLLPVTCSNGNTILNPSLSFETYQYYFSSLYMYDIGIAGPDLNDFTSWRQWYLPEISDEDKISNQYIYGLSEDCSSSCIYNTDDFNSNSAYYMTGNFFLCAWITKGDCDMDSDTYQCYECARKGGRSTAILPGVCSHLEYSVDQTVHTDHFQCTGNNDNVKPSIGLGEYCVCYKPIDSMLTSLTMNTNDFEDNIPSITDETEPQQVLDSSSNIVYLSSDDFLYGTYRIKEAGTYIITEDIWFNFNAPLETDRTANTFSANSYEDFWWMPRIDGSQEDTYEGGSTWSGPYQLGFFAGITVECSDVIIDLNGHSVGMSEEFYVQQRFFSIIELATKNFVSGQGPVDFGPYLNSASNVVIKNGILNRASHHAIHGNGVEDIVIDNINALNFDVAGIQLNGFNNIEITNCDIGPSALPPVNGRYLHARTLLRRYRHLVDNYGEEELLFANREYVDDTPRTVRQYVDELIEEMDMIYNHIVYGIVYDDADVQWGRAKQLFLNPSPYQHGDGGVVYGILLNSRGGAVMGFGNAPSESLNALIENVLIHDLGIAPIEKLKFKTDPVGGATRGPVADVFDVMAVSDEWGELDDVLSAKYVGTAYSDVQIVMSTFEESWYVLDHTCFDGGIIDWSVHGVPFVVSSIHGGCNTDIQLHINKGVIGLRIDNVRGFNVNNIAIHDLKNTGDLGQETICGAYSQGNAHQDPLITPGYTGTEGYGITITQATDGSIDGAVIDGIETFYGNCNGIALFKDSSVSFNNIVVSNIIAGSQLDVATHLRPYQKYLPNKIARACSVFDNDYNTQYVIGMDGVNAHHINGFLICNQEDGDLIGECSKDNACIAQYEQSYFDELALLSQDEYRALNHSFNLYLLKGRNYVSCAVGFVIFTTLLGFLIYYRSSLNKYKRKWMQSFTQYDEYTPLLD